MSFRARILIAMLLVVAGIAGAAFLIAQRSIDSTFRRMSEERFENETAAFLALREARLGGVLRRCKDLARSVRLVAAIHEGDPDLLYRIALDELRDLLRSPGEESPVRQARFFRLVDARGRVVPPADARAGLAGGRGDSRWERMIARLGTSLGDEAGQQVGYLAPKIGDARVLHEVIATRVADPVSGEDLGALVIGFVLADPSEAAGPHRAPIRSGIWLGERLFSRTLGDEAERAIAPLIASTAGPGPLIEIEGVSHRTFVRPLAPGPDFPPAFLVGLYSTEEEAAQQRELRLRLAAAAALAAALGVGLSLFLALGLSGPVRDLAAGTAEILRGNFGVRVPVRRPDEMGRLAASFNAMAEGLALKERYRGLLDVVADPDVAEAMIGGRIPLSGELREVSVLFCDIRGFTRLTERMEPGEVIELLNEHMAALTSVVYEHRGVVDKFMGDALMALFGAPRSGGDDARNAVRAASRMIEARRQLNDSSRHPLEIGIGIASGSVVAGFTGAENRRNYTVLGARVNLAARLCDRAAAMEILIDEETRVRIAETVRSETLGRVALRGFRDPVSAWKVASRS